MRRTILAVFLLTTELAHAAPGTAKEHFQRGEALYEATRYEAALREFEVAQSLEPVPGLLYDIAVCLEKLGRKEEAAKAYERFLQDSPDTPNAADVHKRIAALRAPAVAAPAQGIAVQPPVPQPTSRRYLLPGVVGGVALAFAVTGAGLLGSASSDYHALEGSCSPTCQGSSWAGLPAREHAGEAMLGLAAAAAVVDVALWVRAARRK